MSNADIEDSDTDENSAAEKDDIVRINMRLPREKYEWLQEHLDSFTTDTARFQHLVQFYADHQDDIESCEV